jgi:taurine dioxygenase
MRSGSNVLRIEPVTGAIGAEISGIDLSDDLSDAMIGDLRRALLDHLVIFFRDQAITPEQHKAFGRRFGELHIHPITAPMAGHPEIIEVIKEPDETINWGDNWHTDLTALAAPPMGSILYAKEVPPFSGDTQFGNMYLAYETLSPSLRRFVSGLTCLHSQKAASYQSGFKAMANREEASESSAEHPLVRTHPETGKKALFLPWPGWGRIVELSPAESEAMLKLLREHADNPDFACRFRWRKHSLAFWDNRCTRHRATADYFYAQRGFPPHRRHLHRVSIQGDRPV